MPPLFLQRFHFYKLFKSALIPGLKKFQKLPITHKQLGRISSLGKLQGTHLQANPPPTPTMGVQKSFLDAVKSRRTYYALKASSPIPDSRIQELVRTTILEAPSSFNSQSTRLVVLLKAEHEKLWDATKEILRAIVPADKFAATEKRIEGFRNAYGTVCITLIRMKLDGEREHEIADVNAMVDPLLRRPGCGKGTPSEPPPLLGQVPSVVRKNPLSLPTNLYSLNPF